MRILVLAAAAFVVVAMLLGTTQASAHDNHPGLNMWISVDGVPGCSTQSGDGTCEFATNSVFTVSVHIDALPDDISTYLGYDLYLTYEGVTGNEDASSASWPDCGFPAQSYLNAGAVLWGCAEGVAATPSTFVGVIGTTSFGCAASGNVSMLHTSMNYTDLQDGDYQVHAEDPNSVEMLTVNCVQGGAIPPTFVPTAYNPNQQVTTPEPGDQTAAAQSPTSLQTTAVPATATPTGGASDDDDGGSNGWIIVLVIIAVAAVVVVGGGYFGWRYLQGRGGSGS